jgi:hypothetical protein
MINKWELYKIKQENKVNTIRMKQWLKHKLLLKPKMIMLICLDFKKDKEQVQEQNAIEKTIMILTNNINKMKQKIVIDSDIEIFGSKRVITKKIFTLIIHSKIMINNNLKIKYSMTSMIFSILIVAIMIH